MKTKLLIISVLAILVAACSTGTYTTKTYDDDIYFSPADVPPVAMVEDEIPAVEKSAQISGQDHTGNTRIVMSQMEKNQDGTSTLNNYIYQPENKNSDAQAYQMDDQELVESDTTVYYNDEDVKYVINNYYDDDDMDFSSRIYRFHRPFGFRPYFSTWGWGYDPYWSYGYGWDSGWGWDPWYSGGWGYPYYGWYDYYSPFSFGFGGYWGGWYGGYYPYYSNYYSGYYNGWYNGYYGTGGGFYNNHQIARRRSTEMNLPGGNTGNMNFSGGTRASSLKEGNINQVNSEGRSTWVENGHTRSRSIDPSGNNADTKNATIVNNRRPSTANSSQVQDRSQVRTQTVRPATSNTGNVRRTYQPSTTSRTYEQGSTGRQSQNYTPSYNKPRIVNQSNYNNSYTRPRTSDGNYERSSVRSSSGSSGYSEPRSSSSMRQTYRSSSSYSSGSSSTPRSSSYSSPSNYNSSPSYSPSRSSSSSYSSGSSSGGSYSGGSSGGNSGGSSSGGGGGSGHRR